MINKRIGSDFEKEMVDILANCGFWAHFIVPNPRGAQPFDIIAVKNGMAFAIECKTLSQNSKWFYFDRFEENQKMAFKKWIDINNGLPIIAIKQNNNIVTFFYSLELFNERGINIDELKKSEFKKIGDINIYGVLNEVIDNE